MINLSQSTLGDISTMPVPAYPRGNADKHIVHFGVGGFHRAHQAMYLDALLVNGLADGWGITGVGVLSFDEKMRDAMAAQDCLFSLVMKPPNGTIEGRVIGSIMEFLFVPDGPEAVLERLCDPATKIVSLTITESGYPINDSTGEFDPQDDPTKADIAGDGPRQSAFGLIVEALRRRREAGTQAFTIMCCDNIQHNGDVARAAVLGFAKAKDAELAAWIEAEVAFPNSMVDRITPAPNDALRAEVAERFDVADACPVSSESFTQWVMEDRFPAGRPDFDKVGVQLVDDVDPYEMMKLRLLNASHQALAYAGFLAGYEQVHEAVGDPNLHAYLLQAYMRGEAIPTLKPVPGVDLDAYTDELLKRFSNEEVRDTLARLAVDGSDRMSKFLFPVIKDRVAMGEASPACALIVATWARFMEGSDDNGRPSPITDKREAELTEAALADRENPGVFLDHPIFGGLGSESGFRAEYVAAKQTLLDEGVQAAVCHVVSG